MCVGLAETKNVNVERAQVKPEYECECECECKCECECGLSVCNLHGKTNKGDTCESSWLDQSQWALNKNILSKHKGGCYCTQSGSVNLSFLSAKKTI